MKIGPGWPSLQGSTLPDFDPERAGQRADLVRDLRASLARLEALLAEALRSVERHAREVEARAGRASDRGEYMAAQAGSELAARLDILAARIRAELAGKTNTNATEG